MNSVLLATIGWLIVHRTLRIFAEHQMIRQLKRHHELVIQISFVLLCSFLGPIMPILTIFIIGVVFVIPIFLSIIVSRFNELRFHNETVELYDSLLMDVRGGLSVRESVVSSGQNLQWSYPHRETVAFIIKNSGEAFPIRQKAMQERARELVSILNSGSRVADRLKFYRDQWSLSQRLERKIRVATQQTKAQTIVVVGLYIIVASYQIYQNPHFMGSKWFIGGSLLLMLGLALMWKIQGSFRWKV